MNMSQAISAFIDKRLDFLSRSRRSEFWWVQLAYVFVTIIAVTIDYGVLGYTPDNVISPFILLLEIVTLVPMAALTARRLHDVGLTGWAQLPLYLTYIGYIPGFDGFIFDGFERGGAALVLTVLYWAYFGWLLYNLIKDGDRWGNKYGSSPKYDSRPDTFE